jgi:hypothetical protein
MKHRQSTSTGLACASPAVHTLGKFRSISARELIEMDFSNAPVNPHPYGEWRTATGDRVLFNRSYEPLWIKHPDGSVERADPNAWIKNIAEERHFWFDWEHPARSAATRRKLDRLLREWGLR